MNKIELLESWGFKRAPTSVIEFYRLALYDYIRIEVYISFQVFGIDQVDIVIMDDYGDWHYTTLPKIDTVAKIKELIDLI